MASKGLLFAFLAGLLVCGTLRADQVFYYTNYGGGTIQELNVTNGTDTAIVTGLSHPDSLIFSDSNTITFSEASGTLSSVPTSGSPVTTLATGLNFTQDIALDPSGTSITVADTGNDRLIRESLAGGAPTVLATFAAPVRGVVYDAAGNLFVNLDCSQGSCNSPTNQILQIDPTTGAVLKSLDLPAMGDGLTYDPFSGDLWAAAPFSNGIMQIDTALTSFTAFNCTVGGSTVCGVYDGIEADGNGNLDIANTSGYIDVYNEASGMFTFLARAPGIDDLAPVTGAGAPPAVPEPSSLILLCAGLLCTIPVARRKLCI